MRCLFRRIILDCGRLVIAEAFFQWGWSGRVQVIPESRTQETRIKNGNTIEFVFFLLFAGSAECSLGCESDQLFSNLGKWTMDSKVGNRLPN